MANLFEYEKMTVNAIRAWPPRSLFTENRIFFDEVQEVTGVFVELWTGDIVRGQEIVGDGGVVGLGDEKIRYGVAWQSGESR